METTGTGAGRDRILTTTLGFLLIGGLFLTSLYSFLLFHTLAEFFSIAVAFSIFIIAWNSRRFLDHGYFLLVGVAYLFVGGLDLLHTLTYKGMNIFTGFGANLPTQLWLGTRYLESLSLALAPLFIGRRVSAWPTLGLYAAVTAGFLLSIFAWPVFPVCYIDGQGLTPFKIGSEYAIIAILILGMIFLLRKRRVFTVEVLRYLIWSVALTIAAELAFTFYVSVYGLSNLIGHFFKLGSFFFIYRALIVTGLVKPFDLLYRDLARAETRFQAFMDRSPTVAFIKDETGRYQYVNRPFCRLLNLEEKEILGRTDEEIMSPEQAEGYLASDRQVLEAGRSIEVLEKGPDSDPESVWLSWKFPLTDAAGQVFVGGLSLDITQKEKARAEREKLIAELQAALAEVKTLSGLLPICANCKKIRTDEGYWTQIEEYLRLHSEAEFSHGICPDCLKKLYPGYSAD